MRIGAFLALLLGLTSPVAANAPTDTWGYFAFQVCPDVIASGARLEDVLKGSVKQLPEEEFLRKVFEQENLTDGAEILADPSFTFVIQKNIIRGASEYSCQVRDVRSTMMEFDTTIPADDAYHERFSAWASDARSHGWIPLPKCPEGTRTSWRDGLVSPSENSPVTVLYHGRGRVLVGAGTGGKTCVSRPGTK